jgi:hypothetical protein
LLADMEKEGLITIDQEAKGEKRMGSLPLVKVN